jgi:aarF domain-containing kinase
MLRRVARVSAKAVAGTAATGAVACGGFAAYDPGFRRQCGFWATVLPGVCTYRYTSWKYADADDDARAQQFAALHKQYAPVALELILRLRGLFVKFGQVCSVRPEFVPQAYRDAFRVLQSEVPGEPLSVVRSVIEAEFGRPLEEVFSSFDATSCGAASIGQAHAAVTAAGGEAVVVKVQYPDAHWQFMADIECLRTLVSWAQPDSMPAYEEFAKQCEPNAVGSAERAASHATPFRFLPIAFFLTRCAVTRYAPQTLESLTTCKSAVTCRLCTTRSCRVLARWWRCQ